MKKLLTTVAIISMASMAAANTEEADSIEDAIETAYTSVDSATTDTVSDLFDTLIDTAHGEESEGSASTYSLSLSSGKLTATAEAFTYTSGIVYSTSAEVEEAQDDLIDAFKEDMIGEHAEELSDISIHSNDESGADLRYQTFSIFGLIGDSLTSVVDEHTDMQEAALELIEEFSSSRWSSFEGAVTAFNDDVERHNDVVDDYLDAIEAIEDITHITE